MGLAQRGSDPAGGHLCDGIVAAVDDEVIAQEKVDGPFFSDETFYYQIFKAVSGQMRHIAREWELSWGDDGDETFDSIFILVSKENLPQKIDEMFSMTVPDTERKNRWKDIVRRIIGMKPKMKVRLSAPLLLSWLFYGKSFESMVAMLDKQIGCPVRCTNFSSLS